MRVKLLFEDLTKTLLDAEMIARYPRHLILFIFLFHLIIYPLHRYRLEEAVEAVLCLGVLVHYRLKK